MEITVLVEPVSGDGFRAICPEPLRLEANAPTREEAVDKVRQLIEARLGDGAEVVQLRIGNSRHELAPFAGMLKDDPLLSSWKAAMEQYREAREKGSDTS